MKWIFLLTVKNIFTRRGSQKTAYKLNLMHEEALKIKSKIKTAIIFFFLSIHRVSCHTKPKMSFLKITLLFFFFIKNLYFHIFLIIIVLHFIKAFRKTKKKLKKSKKQIHNMKTHFSQCKKSIFHNSEKWVYVQ